jgi:hypothetical protein
MMRIGTDAAGRSSSVVMCVCVCVCVGVQMELERLRKELQEREDEIVHLRLLNKDRTEALKAMRSVNDHRATLPGPLRTNSQNRSVREGGNACCVCRAWHSSVALHRPQCIQERAHPHPQPP